MRQKEVDHAPCFVQNNSAASAPIRNEQNNNNTHEVLPLACSPTIVTSRCLEKNNERSQSKKAVMTDIVWSYNQEEGYAKRYVAQGVAQGVAVGRLLRM